MGKSLNMNYVNCALLVVVLVLVIMCYNKNTEEFKLRFKWRGKVVKVPRGFLNIFRPSQWGRSSSNKRLGWR